MTQINREINIHSRTYSVREGLRAFASPIIARAVEFSRSGGSEAVRLLRRPNKFNKLRLARTVHSLWAEVVRTMKKLMILVAGAVMALAPLTASAARVVVVGGMGGFYGPGWGPYWGPAYGYYPAARLGEVKIDTKSKDSEVFIDGAFAGATKDTRTFHVRPGTYTFEVRHAGQVELSEKVFVSAGQTLHLHPAL
jgi:hypothetical protein